METSKLGALNSANGGGGLIKGYLTAVPFGMLLGVAFYLLAPLLKTPVATATITPTASQERAAAAEALSKLKPTLAPSPTFTVEAAATPTIRIAAPGCIFWDEVEAQQVGKEVCVQGEYLRTFEREDGTIVMAFSEAPGSFQVWTTGKSFERSLEGIQGNCVMARGWLMTSGVRPMIILGKNHKLEACP